MNKIIDFSPIFILSFLYQQCFSLEYYFVSPPLGPLPSDEKGHNLKGCRASYILTPAKFMAEGKNKQNKTLLISNGIW